MDEDERVDAANGDHVGADHGLAKRCGGCEHAEVGRLEGSDSRGLHFVERAEESNREGGPALPLVDDPRCGTVGFEELDRLVEAAAWQRHVTRVKLGTVNNPGLAPGR